MFHCRIEGQLEAWTLVPFLLLGCAGILVRRGEVVVPEERQNWRVSREPRLKVREIAECRAEHPEEIIDLLESGAEQLLEGMSGGAWPVAPRGIPDFSSCWGERERWRRSAVSGGKEASAGPDGAVGERGAIPRCLWGGRRWLMGSLLQMRELCCACRAGRGERRVRSSQSVLLFERRRS